MDKVRRGVLFTAGIAGMMLVVLVFALVIYNNAINSRERTSEVGVIDRINDVELSIKNSLRDIFNLEANINVTIDKSKVIFNEELSNDEDEDFRDTMGDFKAYLELEFKENPKVKINATKVTKNLPLIIKPNSITYTHPEGFGGKEINIIPEEFNFNAYELDFNTKGQSSGSLNQDEGHICSSGNSCIPLIIKTNGGLKFNKTVDMSISNKFILAIGGGTIIVKIQNPGILIIENNAGKVEVKSKLYLNKFNDERIRVSYPENIIEVDLSSLNIFKRGTVDIAY